MLQTMVAHLRERIMAITDKKKDQEQAAMIVEDMNIDYEINDIVQGQ